MFWIIVTILMVCILVIIFMGICSIFDLIPKSNYPKLSYKQFVDYYWINPDKWFLWNNYVDYTYFDQKSIKSTFTSGTVHKKFTFSFIDMLKYRKFKYNIETNKEKQNKLRTDNEAYKILIKGVQKDIDKLKNKVKMN